MTICSNDDVFAYLGVSTPTSQELALMSMLLPMAEDAVKAEVGYSIAQATYTHFLPETDADLGEEAGLDMSGGKVVLQYRGDRRDVYVPERPLRSITTLYEDAAAYGGQGSGDFASSTLLTAGTDYYIDRTQSDPSWSGRIIRIIGNWPARARTVKVTYVAGLTASELAGTTACRGPTGGGVTVLRYVALQAAALAFKKPAATIQGGNAGPITQERLADYAVTYSEKGVIGMFGFQFRLPGELRELLQPFKRYVI